MVAKRKKTAPLKITRKWHEPGLNWDNSIFTISSEDREKIASLPYFNSAPEKDSIVQAIAVLLQLLKWQKAIAKRKPTFAEMKKSLNGLFKNIKNLLDALQDMDSSCVHDVEQQWGKEFSSTIVPLALELCSLMGAIQRTIKMLPSKPGPITDHIIRAFVTDIIHVCEKFDLPVSSTQDGAFILMLSDIEEIAFPTDTSSKRTDFHKLYLEVHDSDFYRENHFYYQD